MGEVSSHTFMINYGICAEQQESSIFQQLNLIFLQ